MTEYYYFNLSKSYNVNDRTMNITQSYNDNILDHNDDKNSNYYISVDRFSLPATSIPIFIFANEQKQDRNHYYSFEMVYDGVSSGIKYVQYVGDSTDANEAYYVYSFQAFINMMNTAIADCYHSISATATFQEPPPSLYIDNNILGISIHENFLNGAHKPITLYGSIELFKFVNGLPFNFSTYATARRNIEFLFYVTPTNVKNSYVFIQSEYGPQTIINWNIQKGLIINSDMSVRNEIVKTSRDGVSNLNKVLTNFDILYTSDEVKPLKINYASINGQWKKIDLMSCDFRNLYINILWTDDANNAYPLYLYYGESINMRLVIIKKKKNIQNGNRK